MCSPWCAAGGLPRGGPGHCCLGSLGRRTRANLGNLSIFQRSGGDQIRAGASKRRPHAPQRGSALGFAGRVEPRTTGSEHGRSPCGPPSPPPSSHRSAVLGGRLAGSCARPRSRAQAHYAGTRQSASGLLLRCRIPPQSTIRPIGISGQKKHSPSRTSSTIPSPSRPC